MTMKKYLYFTLFTLATALMAIPVLAQDNPLFRHIPPDANAVYRINYPAITAKVSWEDIVAAIPFPKKKPAGDETMAAIKDPAGAGLDTHGDMVIASSGKDPFSDPTYITMIIHLSDSSKFRIFLRKNFQGIRIVTNPNKSYSARKNKMGISWNKDLAVFVTVKPPMAMGSFMPPDMMSKKGDNSKTHNPSPKTKAAGPDYAALAMHQSAAALKGYDASFYTTDPTFTAAFSDDADVQMCADHGSSLKSIQRFMPGKMFGAFHPDSANMFGKTYTSLQFGAGKISIKGHVMLKPGAADELGKFTAPPFNPDLLARLPKGDLLGALNFRIDLSMMEYMLNKTGLRHKIDSSLATKDLSLSDILHAFKGDFLIAVLESGLKDSAGKPKPEIYFVAPIGDLSSLHKLGESLKKAQDSATADTTGKKPGMLAKIQDHFAVKDNILVIADSKQAAESYFAGTEKRNTDFVTDDMKNNGGFIYINLKTVLNLFVGSGSGKEPNEKKQKMLEKLHALDKLIITGGAIHNGEIGTSFELQLDNNSENSLKTLMGMMH
jgi:hypothetical protein